MKQPSGRLIVRDGKLILTGEIFDEHGSYDFEAFVDTGSSFGIILTRVLADAVCAPVLEEINISAGAGSANIPGHKRKVNLRFGELVLKNYEITVPIGGSRNLVGIQFLQDTNMLLLADFSPGKTDGGVISNDRRFASALGKTAHCFLLHKSDIVKLDEPCQTCEKMANEELELKSQRDLSVMVEMTKENIKHQ